MPEDTFDFFDDRSNTSEEHWVGMPEYDNVERKPPVITATFNFRNVEDFLEFNTLLKKHIYGGEKAFDGMQRKDVKSTWYPLFVKGSKFVYRDET